MQNRSVQKIKQLQTQANKAMTVLTKIKPSFKKAAVSALLSLAAAVPSSVALSQLFASPSEAASTCECVGYVKNRFGITVAVGHAKDMIYSLPNLGFTRVSNPQPGAVVIMQTTFRGANTTYGHVGIVERTSVRSGNTYLTVRGANQGGNWFIESNCSNVAIVDFATPVNGRSDVSYWVKGNTLQPPTNPIRYVSFSGTSASSGINVRLSALALAQTSELCDASAAIKESTLMLGSTALLREICGWALLMLVGIASQAQISG